MRSDSARVLLHVGLHKTGTTWLQNRVFVDERLGFAAPWGGLADIAVQEFLLVDPLHFDAASVAQRLLPRLSEAAARGLVPVFSHEALSSRPHEGLYHAAVVAERLRAVFPGARVVIGLREQNALLLSLYRQHVRNGGRFTLEQFLGLGSEPAGWAPPCRLDFFEFDRFVTLYQRHFGRESVLVLPLEMLARDPTEYLRSLRQFAGLSGDPAPPSPEAENAGWGARTLATMRLLNHLALPNPLGPEQGRLVRGARRVSRVFDRTAPRSVHASLEARWKLWIAARVGDRFHASNSRLAAATGLPLERLGYP